MTYEQFDVIVVPFPFTDTDTAKRRPALVLSNAQRFNVAVGHSVMAMITTASHSSWALDVPLNDLEPAGLAVPSIVRMKLFTLDHTLVLRGHLKPRLRALQGKCFRACGSVGQNPVWSKVTGYVPNIL